MPSSKQSPANPKPSSSAAQDTAPAPPSNASSFAIPRPLKALFDSVPLQTYPPNSLPVRSPRQRDRHALYVFTTEDGARNGAPSFNPSCLKWQAYLKFLSIDFITVSSNNHASPSGALPFLIPSCSSADPHSSPLPITSAKLQKWSLKEKGEVKVEDEPNDMRYEAYMSLLDHRIRRAWLSTLYLNSDNFDSVAAPLYIHSASSNSIIRFSSALALRRAAADSISSSSPSASHSPSSTIEAEAIYAEADEAFSSLETLLADDKWFFGKKSPGLMDAAVFAYTFLCIEGGMQLAAGKENNNVRWKENVLGDLLLKRKRLVKHRQRILKGWFSGK